MTMSLEAAAQAMREAMRERSNGIHFGILSKAA
jgi:hypothetical protein